MAGQEYQVRLTAETKQATDKISAVENSLDNLTKNPFNVRLAVDANAARRAAEHTQAIANNIRKTSQSITESSSVNIVSGASLASAASLASQFYGIRKDVKGLNQDLGKALGKTNLGEFMRTEDFLEKVLENSRARSKEIVETYANIRELPGAADVFGPVENYARAQAWQQFGDQIAEQTLQGVQAGLQQGVVETKRFFYGEVFEDIAKGTNATIDTLARLGLAIQGVQLLLGPLAAAWGAAFNQIIGQNVRLQEVILSTQTTLASTGRVVDNNTGKELLDPLEKINALGGDVEKAIANIRVRSLDLAGVTSQQIIDIFGVVATSISQVNGNIKDAEDLAISFTAALGTLGIPFYQARQEIGSILGGYITEDSLLAKRLQISNADITKARNSIDGVVGYLQKKLQVAVAGQAISSKSFSGVLSNIQEIFENIAQRIGEPLLKPLVAGLTVVYEFLKNIQGVVIGIGSYLSKTFVNTLNSVVTIFKQSTLIQSITASLRGVAEPFTNLARSIELGLNTSSLSLVDAWISGLQGIPRAFQGVINGLISLGNFLKLQIDLVTKPIIQLLDQTRERIGGVSGVVQGLARMPQFIFFEGPDAFTKGWDTIASTIQYAAQSLSKFALAIVQLKLTEFTAKLRAAATVFELFGSLVLGKLNLALSFFDFLGNIAGSGIAKFTVSLLALNRLINNTEFFGLKSLFQFLAVQRPIFLRFIQDIGLFAKGFKDAGNIDRYVKSMQEAQTKLLQVQKLSKDPVVANTANIRIITKELTDLRAAQIAAVKAQADPGLIGAQAERIKALNTQLREANSLQRQFSASEKAAAAARLALGTRETAAAQEALRQAGVITSGAAAAKAVSSVVDTLGQKIGLTKEQMKGLGGAFNVATKSIRTFLTVSLGINIAFTAISLAIAGVMSWMQQMEEAEKKRQMEAYRTSQVNKILASSYEGLRKAAAGGDVAAQSRLEDDREAANAAFQIQQEKKAKLIEEDIKLNNQLAEQRSKLAQTKKGMVDMSTPLGFAPPGEMFGADITGRASQAAQISGLLTTINGTEKQRLAIKQKIADVDRKIYDINLAQSKVQETDKLQDQFTVLAERRRDLEEKIKTTREDFTKEITDKEFQARQDLLGLEQQKRREIQQGELRALQERFSLLAQNSSDQDAKIIELVKNYEQALLEAAGSEANRRTEYVQKENQLRKEIEDYAFKMAREKVNLEKQVGAYQKEVESWKSRQQKVRFQEELAHQRSIQSLQGIYFKPYNVEQQQQFLNAATQAGYSGADAYVKLSVVPKSAIGITGEEPANEIISRLRNFENRRAGLGLSSDLDTLIKNYLGVDQDQVTQQTINALRAEYKTAFNTQRFYVPKPDSNNLREPDLRIDYTGMQARLQAANASILEAQRSLDEAVSRNDRSSIQAALDQFRNPAVFGSVKESITGELNTARTELRNAVTAATQSVSKSNLSLEAEIASLDTVFQNMVASLLRSNLKISDAEITKFISTIKDGRIDGAAFDNLMNKLNVPAEVVDKLGRMLANLNIGAQTYEDRLRQTYPQRKAVDETTQLTKAVGNIANKKIEMYASALADSFNQLDEAVRSNTRSAYSLRQAEQDARSQVLSFVTKELAALKGEFSKNKLEGIFVAARSLQEQLLAQARALDPFRKALDVFTIKLQRAQQAADITASGLRQFYLDVTIGSKSFKDALRSFIDSLNKGFGDMVADLLIKPLRDRILDIFKGLFKVGSAEDALRQAQIDAVTALQTAGQTLNNAGIKISEAADRLSAPYTAPAPSALAQPAAPKESNPPSAVTSYTTSQPSQVVPFDFKPTLSETSQSVSNSFTDLKLNLDTIKIDFANISTYSAEATKGLDKVYQSSGQASSSLGSFAYSLKGIVKGIGGQLLSGLFNRIFDKLPFKASGGPISSPAIVGEKGPELFVPGRSGTIIPNNALGGSSTNVVVNVDANGSKVQGDNQQASQLGRVIASAVQQELIRQKRPGGLLA